MDIEDVVAGSLTVVSIVFGLLAVIALIALLVRRSRGRTIRQQFPHPWRSVAIRLGIALAAGASVFLLVTAALVLNSHRPPADVSPVIQVLGADGPATVNLEMAECGKDLRGTIRVVPGSGKTTAGIYSERDGLQQIPLDKSGKGTFTLRDPTAKRGLLSCYLQLPVISGDVGATSIKLAVDDQMEVDTVASIPTPSSYSHGRWIWKCPAGERCPALATSGLAIEEGAKQVIVLILAAVFGAIIALFIGEALIEPLRRRLDRPDPG